MYFIELLIKKIKKKQIHKNLYDPLTTEFSDDNRCEHIFMPIDSSGEILSCRNCGYIVRRKDLKNINFFKNNNY